MAGNFNVWEIFIILIYDIYVGLCYVFILDSDLQIIVFHKSS